MICQLSHSSRTRHQASKFRASFTLVEMVVVVGIILVLLAITLPAISTMLNHAHVVNADQLVSNILKVAAQRSRMIQYSSYGVFFYIDEWNHQVACFIKRRGYPDNVKGERWPDVIDRFMIDVGAGKWCSNMKDFVRISPLGILEWTDEQIVSENYRAGKHRNMFVVAFQRGTRCSFPVSVEDKDEDEDGLGDLTSLPVNDVVRGVRGTVEDMLVDVDDQMLKFDVKWGVLIYDENLYQDQPVSYRPQFIKEQHARTLLMDRYGRTVRGEK